MNKKLTDHRLAVIFAVSLAASSVFGFCGFLAGRALYGRKLRRRN